MKLSPELALGVLRKEIKFLKKIHTNNKTIKERHESIRKKGQNVKTLLLPC